MERLPKDPGQAGKAQAQSFVKMLAGFPVKTIAESGSKEVRAEPFAAQWQHGNVDVLLADWNEMYFSELRASPNPNSKIWLMQALPLLLSWRAARWLPRPYFRRAAEGQLLENK